MSYWMIDPEDDGDGPTPEDEERRYERFLLVAGAAHETRRRPVDPHRERHNP